MLLFCKSQWAKLFEPYGSEASDISSGEDRLTKMDGWISLDDSKG